MVKRTLWLLVSVAMLAGCGAAPTGTTAHPTGTVAVANGFHLKEADYRPATLDELRELQQNRASAKVQLQGWFQIQRTSAGILTHKQAWVIFADTADQNVMPGHCVTLVIKDFNGLFKGMAFPDNAYEWFRKMGVVDPNGSAVTGFFTVHDGTIDTDAAKLSDGTVRTRPMR